MKHATLALAVIMLTGLSAGVVGYNGSGDQPHIMTSGSGSSASAATGPNGTMWRAELTGQGSSCATNTTDRVTVGDFFTRERDPVQRGVEFSGTVITSNPCHILDHKIREKGRNTYVFDVTSKPEGQGVCVQCIGGVSYTASFQVNQNAGSSKTGFLLEIRHDGELVKTVEHPDYGNNTATETELGSSGGGFLSGFVEWLRGLFT